MGVHHLHDLFKSQERTQILSMLQATNISLTAITEMAFLLPEKEQATTISGSFHQQRGGVLAGRGSFQDYAVDSYEVDRRCFLTV